MFWKISAILFSKFTIEVILIITFNTLELFIVCWLLLCVCMCVPFSYFVTSSFLRFFQGC
jgi:hypothetical protein